MAVDEMRFRAMASDAHVIVVDGPSDACETARHAAQRLEAIWSRFIESSDIQRLNHSKGRPIQVERATIALIETMIEASNTTSGRYDPTVLRALLTAGYITSIDNPNARTTLPESTYQAVTESPPIDDVCFGPDRFVTLPPTMVIDAGGIGKGLAADYICAELLARGAAGALVSIGGDLAATGTPPEHGGWRVDIENPLDPSLTMAQIMLSGGGVATSSTASRRWQSEGCERHHTVDPTTGEPSNSDLVAITTIAPCGWQAEAHATALLIGGSTDFDRYTTSRQIEAIATTTCGTTQTTPAFATTAFTQGAAS